MGSQACQATGAGTTGDWEGSLCSCWVEGGLRGILLPKSGADFAGMAKDAGAFCSLLSPPRLSRPWTPQSGDQICV